MKASQARTFPSVAVKTASPSFTAHADSTPAPGTAIGPNANQSGIVPAQHLAKADAVRAQEILRDAGRSGTALLAVTADSVFLMDKPKAMDSNIFAGLSQRQQALDVVQLHRGLLQKVLGISEEAIHNQQNIRYVRDAGEAMAQVRSGKANVAFLMNPVRMEQVRDIAFSGDVLPQKSTDFYPKLLSGFTIYALE